MHNEDRREALLRRCWGRMATLEQATGAPGYSVLRIRAEHPELRSPELATRLSTVLGKPQTAAGVRQALHRARDKFADLLVDEVRRSLVNPTKERLKQELGDLGWLEYCRHILDRLPPEG